MRRVIVAMVTASLLGLLLGCVLTACGGSGGGRRAPAPLTSSAYIDDTGAGGVSGTGTSISVPGQAALVESDSPASGCRWSLKVPAGVTLSNSVYDDPSTAPEMKHTRTFTFTVAQPGMYVVKGTYARPGHKKPARTFTFSIYGNPPNWPIPNLVFTNARSGLGTDPGGVFAIVLKENPSTGYAWAMRFGPGLKVLHELAVTPGVSSTPLVGAGGQHLWLFRVGKTNTTVTGSYVRPSAPSSPAAHFWLKITILPPGS